MSSHGVDVDQPPLTHYSVGFSVIRYILYSVIPCLTRKQIPPLDGVFLSQHDIPEETIFFFQSIVSIV